MEAKLIINNEFMDTFSYYEVKNPYDESYIGQLSLASTQNVDDAYIAAENAFVSWNILPEHERMYKLELMAKGLLLKKEDIGNLMSQEIAKPLRDCIKEVERSAEYLIFTANAYRGIEGRLLNGDKMPGYNFMQKTAFVSYEPMGIVLAISPFNYPINLAITKIAPALVTGNCVILKPATQGALSAYLMSEVFCNILPAGVFNFIPGNSSEIGDYLLTHNKLSMIAFTGSTAVGRHIQSLAKVPLYLEMGGKDSAIVLDDAEVDKAATEIIKGAFSYSGQRCTAIKKIIVEEKIKNVLIQKLIENISKLKIGRAEENADITALIDKKSFNYVVKLLEDAKNQNAQIIYGGEISGNIIHPTLVDNVNQSMRIYSEEPFGPILPIITVQNMEEAILVANDTKYGLQSDIFTTNINKALIIARRLNVGTVQINGKSDRGPDNFPFPGIKDSGMGVSGITDALKSMMKTKVTVINL